MITVFHPFSNGAAANGLRAFSLLRKRASSDIISREDETSRGEKQPSRENNRTAWAIVCRHARDKKKTMKEIREHRIYELLNGKYDRVGCDYVILSSDDAYRGIETHRKAVIRAFEILNARFSSYGSTVDIAPDKMTAVRSSIEELLEIPSDACFAERKKADRGCTLSAPIPYWYAFLEPPYGTPYRKSDFIEFNNVLIPNRDDVEVYRWNDDFSNYFDDGKEWWGTGLWSICDMKTGTFTVIGASLTD